MSAAINQSSGQGALFELVARGVKDSYFVKDSADSYFPYDARYKSSIPHLPERRTMIPINGTQFGNTFEVELDPYADILTECAIEIDLPTWFPPLPRLSAADVPVSAEVVNGLYPITATGSADSYGYVNYVGYFLFEKIQFYQDQFLLQEWSGDGLLMKQLTEGSNNSTGLRLALAGGSTNNVRAIQLRATPGHLRIILPLLGTQCPEDGGFPLVCLPWQTFRIKATLRKLEDLVICSDITKNKPSPWTVPHMQYTMADGNSFVFAPKSIYDIGHPTIVLSTVQHYVSPEIQKELRDKKIEIPFRRQFENHFTFGELDYIPLDKGGQAVVTRQLDGRHPTERVMWVFRNTNALENNRLDNFYNEYFTLFPTTAMQPYSDGEFYYRIKLVIAGKDREDLYGPLVWNSITQFSKHEHGTNGRIGSMMWSIGDKYGAVYPVERSPEGTLNFTTADRPTFFIKLANITTNPMLAQRKSEMLVVLEGWNNYIVEGNRGRLMFVN
jgi:hypothetical protein